MTTLDLTPQNRVAGQRRVTAQARLRALQSGIMDLILQRRLQPGDPLPTETELAAELGVGRNTLREALKALQAQGVIEVRHGRGMFVSAGNFDALAVGLTFRGRLSLRHDGREALQLVEVRQALESGLIGAAIDRMTPEQLVAVEESLCRMESLSCTGAQFLAADAEFHRRIFDPLHNQLLVGLLEVFCSVYRRIQLELDGTAEEGAAQDTVQCAALHRAIFEAVAAADKVLAAQRLRDHFEVLRERIGRVVCAGHRPVRSRADSRPGRLTN